MPREPLPSGAGAGPPRSVIDGSPIVLRSTVPQFPELTFASLPSWPLEPSRPAEPASPFSPFAEGVTLWAPTLAAPAERDKRSRLAMRIRFDFRSRLRPVDSFRLATVPSFSLAPGMSESAPAVTLPAAKAPRPQAAMILALVFMDPPSTAARIPSGYGPLVNGRSGRQL